MLLSRRNQLLLEFSFWNEPLPRQGPNIYELRTYKLKVSGCGGPTHTSGRPLDQYTCGAVVLPGVLGGSPPNSSLLSEETPSRGSRWDLAAHSIFFFSPLFSARDHDRMGQQLVSDCFPSMEGAKVGKGPPGAGEALGQLPPPCFSAGAVMLQVPPCFSCCAPGLGPLSTGRRTRRQSAGSSPRSGNCMSCTTSGVSRLPATRVTPWVTLPWGLYVCVGGLGASSVPSPQPTRTCSPGKRRGTRPGERGAGMRMCTTRVSGTPCLHWGPPAHGGDPLSSPRSRFLFQSR